MKGTREKAKHWFVGVFAIAATTASAVGGCGDDVTNNYSSLGGDSGIDVAAALGTLGCTAGKKECVTDAVARVCPADGSAWVAVSCRAGEKCTDGDCKSVAGGPTAACVPGDGACLPGNKALRCKEDGTGYEQSDCPPNTLCTNRGVCMGAYAVGSSSCSSDRRSINVYNDGFHATTSMCAPNEYCVNVHNTPFNIAACKPAQCKPTAAGAYCGEQTICGDPSNAANDQTKYVASCVETPDGFKWVGAPCAAGTTCNPVGSPCATNQNTGGRTQAACTNTTCTEGAMRCAPDGSGVQTCGADGRYGAATQCNYAAGERCFVIPGTAATVTPKAVCGDPACAVYGEGVCEEGTGKIRKCDANGKLTAAQTCTMGRCQYISTSSIPAPYYFTGRCVTECTPGSEDCVGSSGYRVCDANGRWGAPVSCASADGGATYCGTYADPNIPNVTKHVCYNALSECVPNQRRCVSSDGGALTDQVQVCGSDGKWQAAAKCAQGYCSGGTCVMDCVPGSAVCDPSGTGNYFTCPSDGIMPPSPTYGQSCPGGTVCKRAGVRSLGCLQCVGPALVDSVYVKTAEARCLFEDGGTGGNEQLQNCKADNTWDTPITCGSGSTSCTSAVQTSPYADPGGVRSASCN